MEGKHSRWEKRRSRETGFILGGSARPVWYGESYTAWSSMPSSVDFTHGESQSNKCWWRDDPFKRLDVVLYNRTSLITPCLNSRNELVRCHSEISKRRSVGYSSELVAFQDILQWEEVRAWVKRLSQSRYVFIVRNMGSPKGRESCGDGILIVVDGVTPIQGDGRADYRAKQDRKMSFP